MTPGYRLEQCEDLAQACLRIWRAGLMVSDEATSHVMGLVNPDLAYRSPQVIHAAWLAVDVATGDDVGMALVADPAANDSCQAPVFHLYVHADHQGRGLGTHLLRAIRAAWPHAHGHYTPDSVRLYATVGVLPANLPQGLSDRTDQAAARREFIAGVEQERARFDAQVARMRYNRTSPRP